MRDAELIGITRDGECVEIPIGHYPNGEPLITVLGEYRGLLARPTTLASLLTGLFFLDALAERGLPIPALVLPCLPGQRQDRLNDTGDVLFTAKSIARAINARHCPKVVVVDPHSDVMPALIDRCVVIPAAECSPRAQYAGVIAPDAGAEKRAWKVAERMGCPLIHAGKHRSLQTGALTGFWLQDMTPGHYLVVDDLCDGGGTFVGLAAEIAKAAVTADLYVTHGLFTKGTDVVTSCYRTVYTTDSTIGAKPNVTILPICRALLKEYT